VSVPPPPDLSEEDGRTLLRLARAALQAHFRAVAAPGPRVAPRCDAPIETFPSAAPEDGTGPDRLAAASGVFVTLHLDGTLRGCVGSLDGRSPLREAVGAAAVAAAFADPRFDPLPLNALDRIDVEVTVLGAVVEIEGPAAIRIGRHGLIVSRRTRRGLLLPQVAAERGWDAETFLAEACRKAGLEPLAWRSGARLEAFEALVFREERGAGRDAARGQAGLLVS
jgi:AmmeMemoRadiSam system protein A